MTMTRTSKLGVALLLSTAPVFLGAMPTAVEAQSAGVDALVKQAQYWRSKGREDLAQQALKRARALDPNNPALRTAAAPKPAPAPAPKPAPKPAPRAVAAKPTPAPTRTAAATPRPAAPRATPAPTPAPAPVSAADRAGRARVAGFDALNDGNLSSATASFQRALGVNRRDPDALGGLGLVRLREGQFAEAASLLEQASANGKASQWAEGLASARFFAGVDEAKGLIAQNRLADAQGRVEGLVRSGYKEPGPALELLADIYERQGRYADAADLYRQAAQGGTTADDKRLQLRAARGRALAAAERGDDFGAVREFQQGLVLDPSDPWIRYEFAQFQIERGRVPEAESLIRSLASSGNADSLYAAALLNNDLGRASEADRLVTMIPEAQRTAPMRNLAISVKTDAAIARAKAMGASGQGAQAVNALRQLGAMASIPAGKQAAVANALFDLGDTQGAAEVAANAANGRIDNIADYEGLIGVLTRTGRDDLAQLALQRASQMAGTSADGQKVYARISAGMMVGQADAARLGGRYAESFDILQQAYGAAPDNTEIMSGLARLYQTGGMPAKAAQTYQLVLARKPNDKDALLGLADTAQAAGDRNLSEQAQRQVMRLYGQDYRVRMALANVEQARGNDRAAVGLLKDARELYARQSGGVAMGGNPFAGMNAPGGMGGGSSNPFRNQMQAAPQQVNPFALGGGTRLPTAYPQQQQSGFGYAAPQGNFGGQQASGFGAAPGLASGQSGFGGYAGTQAPQAASYAAPDRYASPVGSSAPATGWAAPVDNGGFGGNSYGGPQVPVAYTGDPVMTQIQSQIDQLAQDTGPRVDVQTGYRGRSGETGLSKLDEIKGSAKFSTGAAGGRVFVKGEAVVIDAGRPTGSGLARFGRNATPEAQGIVAEQPSALVNADSQNASGVAFSAGYESDAIQLEGGTTPVGMGKTKFAGRAAVSPKIGQNVRATAFVEHKPVTDSIVSYAGTRDPVTGESWGQVMRTAGGIGLSYDENGSGVYGEGRYYRLRGHNVTRNVGFEANVGGYLEAYRDQHSRVTVGLNVNYQGYDKSQNYFTFGNGGYFSPQSFISVGFPVSYTMQDERWDVSGSFTPGFQSYKEDQSPIFPTDDTAQAELNALKAQNDDVRSYYDSLSKTGFALSAQGSLYYKITPNTRIGGELGYNTFGSYDEFRSILGVRQSFGSTGK
ncbi:cellulose synthase subunit BcsC-related outer membrane protein [Novosphingobium kaempferiae]|uniref:cellulose synthase subunit BcsC-related outer membrane protein n=1 Tax=Novosphingobium kaempferiae TaxID=2896849 RepID=UPI001E5DC399|nr:cellulose synthase subunit BcsC-related outer membrane protein [Novosphingobium kaempferiae]